MTAEKVRGTKTIRYSIKFESTSTMEELIDDYIRLNSAFTRVPSLDKIWNNDYSHVFEFTKIHEKDLEVMIDLVKRHVIFEHRKHIKTIKRTTESYKIF